MTTVPASRTTAGPIRARQDGIRSIGVPREGTYRRITHKAAVAASTTATVSEATPVTWADDTARISARLLPERSNSNPKSKASPRYVINWYAMKLATRIGVSATTIAAANATLRLTPRRPNSQSAQATSTPVAAASVRNDPVRNATAWVGVVT